MEKKKIILSFPLIALIISGVSNIVLFINNNSPPQSTEIPDLIVGVASGPDTLDPVDSLDSASNLVLEQVVETLFSYDLTDLDLPRINLLAHSYWWENNTTLHIQLKEGILFHDGTPFNAEAAKWNLDRLLYLTNCSGTNTNWSLAQTQSLWMFPDGDTPIMNTITTVGEYNITIILNDPYGPFLNTLAYINAGMISPTSHATDETKLIILTTGKPIGTGPFKYDFYVPDYGVFLSRWEGYWRNLANFGKIKFAIIPNLANRNNAMLFKSVDFLIGYDPSYIPSFETDPSITVKQFTDDTGIPNLRLFSLQFNCQRINRTWRKAMSFAINYTYIINEMRDGLVVRAKSPISPAFGASFNASVEAADFNITKAREVVVSMGFGDMGWSDAQWKAVAESNSPFLSVVYYCNTGNYFQEDAEVVLSIWMKNLGIYFFSPASFPENPPLLEDSDCAWKGWAPTYLDPYNMLDPLYNPLSRLNIYQINDTTLNAMMALALETTDDTARNDIYKDIQWYLSEELYPHAFAYHSKVFYVHSADLYGVKYNAMGRFEAYGIWKA